jgi:hypothetical protein
MWREQRSLSALQAQRTTVATSRALMGSPWSRAPRSSPPAMDTPSGRTYRSCETAGGARAHRSCETGGRGPRWRRQCPRTSVEQRYGGFPGACSAHPARRGTACRPVRSSRPATSSDPGRSRSRPSGWRRSSVIGHLEVIEPGGALDADLAGRRAGAHVEPADDGERKPQQHKWCQGFH